MDNCICRADFEPTFRTKKKTSLIIVGIFFIVYVLLFCVPSKAIVDELGTAIWSPISKLIWTGIGCSIGLYVIIYIWGEAEKFIAEQCSLYLTDKEIKGTRKYTFSSKDLTFPIDKVDNIMVVNSVWDKIRGGKTIAVRTASGLVKFPWVQNADEFVAKALETIQEFKDAMQKNTAELNSAVPAVSEDSEIEKIKKLKELMDEGLISQEEFESKRKELLEKI